MKVIAILIALGAIFTTSAQASRHPNAEQVYISVDAAAKPSYAPDVAPAGHHFRRAATRRHERRETVHKHHLERHREAHRDAPGRYAVTHRAVPEVAPAKAAAKPPAIQEAALDEYVPGAAVLDLDAARDYLIATVEKPGGTMQRQGIRVSIERLHPAFAVRLAAAVREARSEGIPAFVFSAYRPPNYGVGGYKNKFDSAHTYGLAADMGGIGGPCSKDAKEWHRIVARHGLYLPYGACNGAEWNHTQLMQEKGENFVDNHHAMRRAVNGEGPINKLAMWVYSGIKRIVLASEITVAVEPKITEPEPRRHYAEHRHRHYAHHRYKHYARA